MRHLVVWDEGGALPAAGWRESAATGLTRAIRIVRLYLVQHYHSVVSQSGTFRSRRTAVSGGSTGAGADRRGFVTMNTGSHARRRASRHRREPSAVRIARK